MWWKILCLSLMGSAIGKSAGASSTLSMAELVALAQKNASSLRLIQAQEQSVLGKIADAKVSWLKNPELSASLGPVFDNHVVKSKLEVELMQKLSLSGEYRARRQAAEALRELNQQVYENTQFSVTQSASYFYREWQLAQRKLALVKSQRDYASELQTIGQFKLKAGQISQMDLALLKSEEAASEIEIIRAESKFFEIREKLALLVDQSLDQKVPNDYQEKITMPSQGLDDVFALAAKFSKMSQMNNLKQQNKEKVLLANQRSAWPDLGLTVSYEREGFLNKSETSAHTLLFGLNIELPLFQRSQGNILSARSDLLTTRIHNDIRIKEQRSQIAQGYRHLKLCAQQVLQMKSGLLMTVEKSLNDLKDAFAKKGVGVASVIAAKKSLFSAKMLLLDALEEYYAAKNRLEQQVGFSLDSGKNQTNY